MITIGYVNSNLYRISSENIMCSCWGYLVEEISLIFVEHWIWEIFKLGKDDDSVSVGKKFSLRGSQGKNTAQEVISGGTVIFNLSALHGTQRILKTECKKKTF